MMPPTLSALDLGWTLTECSEQSPHRRSLMLQSRSMSVGRSNEADLTIQSSSVSKSHARIMVEGDALWVEDLGSTNGTYVNGQRVTRSVLASGDLLGFANVLYRVGRSQMDEPEGGTIEETQIPWAQTLLSFDKLMSDRLVVPHFQPIITLADRACVAYEVLARSGLDELRNPAAMFGAAERLGQQASLSELMRSESLRVAERVGVHDVRYYLNTHPVEVGSERLDDSLRSLRSAHPTANITVEIHEAAVTSVEQMKQFKCLLAALDMQLSYDDFGAGQGRLMELCEVPPHVLKFDMQLIRDIDTASKSRQDLLSALVRIALDLGTIPLAEGVETESEHEVCTQMGFELGQGFHYGRPATFESTSQQTMKLHPLI